MKRLEKSARCCNGAKEWTLKKKGKMNNDRQNGRLKELQKNVMENKNRQKTMEMI